MHPISSTQPVRSLRTSVARILCRTRSNCSRRATLTHNNSDTLEKRSVDASLADLDYISLCEESPEGGQAFGFPCSSTTSDLEPGGKTCRDFKNSIKSSCKFGDRASKANR